MLSMQWTGKNITSNLFKVINMEEIMSFSLICMKASKCMCEKYFMLILEKDSMHCYFLFQVTVVL